MQKKINFTSFISSYIFRLYNGDHHSYELEAVNNFLSICDNLKANVNFESSLIIVESIVLNCHSNNLYADSSTKILLHKDLADIFKGPDSNHPKMFLLSSLSDTISLFEAAKQKLKESKSIKKESRRKNFSSQFPSITNYAENFKELANQSHFFGCQKKLEFYLSFIQHNMPPVLDWKTEPLSSLEIV
jgi:hypothetical protein